MLKIVKGYGYGFAPSYSFGEPVKIDNTVYTPGEDEETGEVISAEEIKRRAEEEKAAQKAENERRVKEAVEAQVAKFVAERSAEMEKEHAAVMEKARSDAASITAEAKAATMAVMEKAKRECAILKEQAKKEGHDEGYKDGFAEGKQQSLDKYKKYIDASGKLLAEINSRKEAYYISNEEEMRDTLIELMKKAVHTELRTNPAVIESLIADAAKNFRNADYLKITLAEDGLTERFRTDEKLVKELIPFIPDIEVVLDRDAEEGTVIEDDGSQIVDAGIPTQLEFLQEIIKNTRGEGGSEPVRSGGIAADAEVADTLEAAAAADTEEAPPAETAEEEAVPAEEIDEEPVSAFAEIMKEVEAEKAMASEEAAAGEAPAADVQETLFDMAEATEETAEKPKKRSGRKAKTEEKSE